MQNNAVCLTYLEQKAGKKQSEFEMLSSSNLSIDDMEPDNYPLAKIFEQKVSNAINDVVDLMLAKSTDQNPEIILQNISSKIPSTVLVRYARAGKNYVSIDHAMGDLGNLFFSGVVDRATKNQTYNCHTITQENKICFIFRQ